MATEKRLIPDGKQVELIDLDPGTIFAFGDDCIAVKSEYTCRNGLIEAYIIGSGELFWGGAKTAEQQNLLMVQPLEIVEVDAVEVTRCHNCQYHEPCKPYNKVWCPKMGKYMKEDGFCSEGVKKDG